MTQIDFWQEKENTKRQEGLDELKSEGFKYALIISSMYRVSDGLVSRYQLKGFNTIDYLIGHVNGEIVKL